VLLTLFRKGNGMIIASLRSRDGEAQQIAEQLKGGGHPNAAGATLPRSIQQIPDAIEYLKQVLNPPSLSDPDGLDGLESALTSTVRPR
jgi:nanoRNase/pAp phosphatase (c-di-AMP/oligoRNAs hydrolase)